MIELINLYKTYEEGGISTEVLKDINIKIQKGEMVAVMGPSGSGKSTFLNILGCLEKPSKGTYLLDGEDVCACKDSKLAKYRNQTLGFVVQDFALIERYTVRKNVEIPLCYSKVPLRKQREKVDAAIERVVLKNKKDSFARNLSGGQKQRVAIARAIVNDAEIILCDEPTGALDQKTWKDIMELFLELHKKGKTIVIVTHDPKVAEYCQRTIRIEDGRIATENDRKVDVGETQNKD